MSSMKPFLDGYRKTPFWPFAPTSSVTLILSATFGCLTGAMSEAETIIIQLNLPTSIKLITGAMRLKGGNTYQFLSVWVQRHEVHHMTLASSKSFFDCIPNCSFKDVSVLFNVRLRASATFSVDFTYTKFRMMSCSNSESKCPSKHYLICETGFHQSSTHSLKPNCPTCLTCSNCKPDLALWWYTKLSAQSH